MVKSHADLDAIFAALGDRNRRALVSGLLEGEQSLSNVAAPLGISLPGVMKHVAVLEKSGLVVSEKRGRHRYLRLQVEPLKAAQTWLEQTQAFWTSSLGNLEKYLKENP